eukprot:m.129742 g.129742  ORF g.129742 m.129742 type:complete len:63 (+) comp29422_c0_seq1:1717-1905(+)
MFLWNQRKKRRVLCVLVTTRKLETSTFGSNMHGNGEIYSTRAHKPTCIAKTDANTHTSTWYI